MKSVIMGGLAAGSITVLLCTSHVGSWIQKRLAKVHSRFDDLLNCCFCTSWWVSIAMLEKFTLTEWAATVAIANFTVLGIHMAMATVEPEGENVQLDQELVGSAELQRSVEECSPSQVG
jgi:hypothetical protein